MSVRCPFPGLSLVRNLPFQEKDSRGVDKAPWVLESSPFWMLEVRNGSPVEKMSSKKFYKYMQSPIHTPLANVDGVDFPNGGGREAKSRRGTPIRSHCQTSNFRVVLDT